MSTLAGDYWRLPGDIIIEILSRLPVKSISKFKCVCKSWRLLFNDIKFCKRQDDIQKKINNRIKIIAGMGSVLYSIDAYNNSNDLILSKADKIVDYPLYDKKHEYPDCKLGVLGSCNGLVCIRSRFDRICFWNVSTKDHKIVLEVKVHDQRKSSWCKYGFGYDIKNQDYKLVRFRCFEDKHRGTQIKVYSLASNSWSSALYTRYTLSSESRPTALYFNGALHWLTDDAKHLISFDLGEEKIREVPGPIRDNFFDKDMYQYKFVDVLGGFLCIIGVVPGDRGDVWVMRESWTKEFSVPQHALAFQYFRPLGYVGNGKQVLLSVRLTNEKDNVFVCYNPKRKMAEVVNTHDSINPKWRQACTYEESLFSLPGKRNSVGILHYLEDDHQVEQEEGFSEPHHKRRRIAS